MVSLTDSNPNPQKPRRVRRRLPVAMRIFLGFLALLCTATAWIGVRGYGQRNVVRRIQGTGGFVEYSGQVNAAGRDIPGGVPHGPAWLRRYIGNDFFDEPVAVRIYNSGRQTSDPDAVLNLRRLRKLNSVVVDGRRLTRHDLHGLSELKELRSLYLAESALDDSDTELLRGLPLTWLSLHRTRVSDKGLQNLAELHSLRYLDLTRTRVSDKGLHWLEDMTSLRTLILRRCKVTRGGTNLLQKKLPDCRIEWEPLSSNP